MLYGYHIAVAIPIASLATAQIVSRTLDPATGGEFAFKQRATDSSGAQWAVYTSPIMKVTYGEFTAMQNAPSALLGAIEADIAVRWMGQTPPTLAEVTAFCDTVKYSSDMGALLEANKLVLVITK